MGEVFNTVNRTAAYVIDSDCSCASGF